MVKRSKPGAVGALTLVNERAGRFGGSSLATPLLKTIASNHLRRTPKMFCLNCGTDECLAYCETCDLNYCRNDYPEDHEHDGTEMDALEVAA